MLILGLLAAIGVPSFLSQKDKAHDGVAKVAVRAAETAIITYSTDNEGSYADASVVDLERIESTLTDADLEVVDSAANGFEIAVTSTTGNRFTIIRHPSGSTELTCVDPGSAGCPSSGVWG